MLSTLLKPEVHVPENLRFATECQYIHKLKSRCVPLWQAVLLCLRLFKLHCGLLTGVLHCNKSHFDRSSNFDEYCYVVTNMFTETNVLICYGFVTLSFYTVKGYFTSKGFCYLWQVLLHVGRSNSVILWLTQLRYLVAGLLRFIWLLVATLW